MPGMPFEHKVVTDLISNRCRFVLPVFSPNFLNSEDEYGLNFAEALAIGQLMFIIFKVNIFINIIFFLTTRKRLSKNYPLYIPDLYTAQIACFLYSTRLHADKPLLGLLGENEEIDSGSFC